jgi:hypothetical protein
MSTLNLTAAPSILSLPCRAPLNCQPSTELTHQAATSFLFIQLNCTYPAWGSRYIASGLIHQETQFFCYYARVRFRWNVFNEPLLRNGLNYSVFLLLRVCMLRALPSNGRCL